MKNVLVASTYYEGEKSKKVIPNEFWLKQQLSFLERNTASYDFAVYLNMISNKKPFRKSIVIGKNDTPGKNARLNHRQALREIINYFREHQKDYRAFCILDSDCFPIKKGWFQKLNTSLSDYRLKFASMIRLENGESFPHPATIFIPASHINEDLFNFPDDFDHEISQNLINGEKFPDTGTSMTFWNKEGELLGLPLVRSNIVNLHPLYAGIYGDLFYHHGMGSCIRVVNKDRLDHAEPNYKSKLYWMDYGNYNKNFMMLFDLIMKHPQKFINTLRGESAINRCQQLL